MAHPVAARQQSHAYERFRIGLGVYACIWTPMIFWVWLWSKAPPETYAALSYLAPLHFARRPPQTWPARLIGTALIAPGCLIAFEFAAGIVSIGVPKSAYQCLALLWAAAAAALPLLWIILCVWAAKQGAKQMNAPAFLADKVARHDVALLNVLADPRSQIVQARIEKVYSSRICLGNAQPGDEIEFVGSPEHWGTVGLRGGDRAIVFMTRISGRLYQDAWRGHMLVEEIEGELHAIFPHKELWQGASVPTAIRDRSRRDPKRSWASAIHFETMESYLAELIGSGKG